MISKTQSEEIRGNVKTVVCVLTLRVVIQYKEWGNWLRKLALKRVRKLLLKDFGIPR